jgi:hypothetical protein
MKVTQHVEPEKKNRNMKLRYLYSLAALSLLTAGCSSDENTQNLSGVSGQKIPFTAVISADEATTRSLTEATDGSAITTSWVKDEQVALIHNDVVDVMTVTAVNEETKAATIKGDITSATNGEAVTVVYPASAVDKDTKAVKTDLLKAQDGLLATISDKLDYRTAKSTLAVSEGGSTFGSSVTLALQNAIWKLSLTDGTNALSATSLVIKDNSGSPLTTVTLAPATGNLYVAMTPAEATGLNFEATVGDVIYTYSNPSVTLKAGKFYQSVMTLQPLTMGVSATGYIGTYDATAHGIEVEVTTPSDAKVKYGTEEGSYTLDASPTFTNAGTHTVYYQVTCEGYAPYTGSRNVEIAPAAATISFEEATITKNISDAAFTNTLTNTGDGDVKYSTTATNVTVDESTGEVTIVGAGEATITATVTDGTNYAYETKTATYKVTVSKNAAAISFATAAPSQTWSATASDNTYKQTVSNTGEGSVTYSVNSDNTCGATINTSTGEVTFTKAGSVTVTATVADTDTYHYASTTATYTLTVAKAAGSISYTTQTVEKLTTDAAFTNALTKVGDGKMTYSSSDTDGKVVTVNSSTGEVTIKGAGEATITATVADSDTYTYATTTATYKVIVKAPAINPRDSFGDGGDPLK